MVSAVRGQRSVTASLVIRKEWRVLSLITKCGMYLPTNAIHMASFPGFTTPVVGVEPGCRHGEGLWDNEGSGGHCGPNWRLWSLFSGCGLVYLCLSLLRPLVSTESLTMSQAAQLNQTVTLNASIYRLQKIDYIVIPVLTILYNLVDGVACKCIHYFEMIFIIGMLP